MTNTELDQLMEHAIRRDDLRDAEKGHMTNVELRAQETAETVSGLIRERTKLIGMVRDLKGLLIEHHSDVIMKPDVCPICTSDFGDDILNRVDHYLEWLRISKEE